MLKIAHRINTIRQLREVPPEFGVEIDLRSEGERLILHHDAFVPGEDFDAWLDHYRHALIILNTKSEGLEDAILKRMSERKIANYFFLDLSIPFMVRQMRKGIRDIAVRLSEYEPLELAANFAGKVNWVWVDCFQRFPLNKENYPFLKENFRICLVSPELQGHSLDRIEEFKAITQGMEIDAVCTKNPHLW